ncbi:MAG TPA: hypothetical protein VGP55_06645 [Chitinophagaceae bacterium]|nr:hypothetical protein [Chitinophagaceae bacterium]
MKITKAYVIVFLGVLISHRVVAQIVLCPPTTVPNASDVSICSPGGSAIIGSPTVPGYNYYWSPATGLNNPNIAQPTASPSQTTTYNLVMVPSNTNLITNGDFESGLTGFNTDYGIYPNGNGCGVGVYGSVAVATSPILTSRWFCDFPDHSPAGTKMLVVDGTCAANKRVWYETISVTANTLYYFSAFVSPASYNIAPILDPLIRIRGVHFKMSHRQL